MKNTETKNIPSEKWLMAVTLFLIGTPIYQVYDLGPLYFDFFKSGTFQNLITPNSETYDLTSAGLVLTEILLNVTIFLGWITLFFLFTKRSKKFPIAFSIQIAFMIFTLVADTLALNLILGEGEIFSTDFTLELTKIGFLALITIPYMFSAEMRGKYFIN